jgi:glycosyltransferase involved in cell wall biosynthesis
MPDLFRADKAVIIVNSLLVHAGIERRTLDFAQFLLSRNLRVEVCVLRELGKVAPLFEQAGIPVRHIHVYDYNDTLGTHSLFPLRFPRLIWYLLRGRFGLVFCMQPPSSIFGRLACFPPLGRRIVAMECYLVSGRSKRRLRLDRWLAKWSRVVCISGLLREELAADARIPAGEIAVVESGLAIAPVVSPQTQLRARLAGRFVFGCVGLLTKRKRQAVLIQAFALLLSQSPSTPRPALVLVGAGEDEADLRRLTAELKIDDDVIFAGEQTHVHDFYPLFDSFVFPSVGEGFGYVWAEAMQHGLPVLCADVRPMCDYIRHNENGLLAKPDDPQAFAAEMLRLIDSEPLRRQLGDRGKNFACEHFDSTRQMQRLLDTALANATS